MDELRGIWRGKRTKNGEWVEGFYFETPVGESYIMTSRQETKFVFKVIPQTLGECTGLRDKNGKPIFEGDICKDENSTYLIVWHMHQWQCKVIHSDCVLALDCSFPLWQWDNCKENGYRTLEIIGNIHDNPEMLE